MQESQDNKKPEEKSGKPAAVKKQTSTVKNQAWKPLYILTAVVMLLLVAGGVYLYRQADINRQMALQAQQKSESLEALQADISRQFTQLDGVISRLASEQDALKRSLAELQQQQPQGNEDWALAEVEYLLIIASHRLLLEKDVNTALSAMEAASARLQAMSGPDLIPLREQITADMNRLRAVNTVDTVGLAIYLADMIDRADELPIKKPDAVLQDDSAAADKSASAGTESGWRHVLGVFWRELKSLVVIKKSGEIRQALLLPDEEYYLVQNLRLELENARLAVLRHDTENLHTSISLLLDWLKRYYDTSDAAVVNIMDTLEQMETLELQPELPDISSSLETLRAYMRQE